MKFLDIFCVKKTISYLIFSKEYGTAGNVSPRHNRIVPLAHVPDKFALALCE